MEFAIGSMPQWKSKPKTSPLDADVEYQKLCGVISNGSLKPLEYAGVYVNESADAKRLGTKHPARLVRDHLRRLLRATRLESDYRLICRQTNERGLWAVGVVFEPKEMAQSAKKRKK